MLLALAVATAFFSSYRTAPYAQQSPSGKITEAEIQHFINSHADVDECESLDQIHIDHLEYYDFLGTGQQQAVVVASTCMTGTAGPDIHAVYSRDPLGQLIELPFLDQRGDPPIANWHDSKVPVFGNPNFTLTVDNGELVVRWGDTSDREAPVVAWYKWNGKEFIHARSKVQGPFPTSYDCSKATKE